MENTSDYTLIGNQTTKTVLDFTASAPRKNYLGFHFFAFLLGLGLLLLLLYKFDFMTIANPISQIGWVFFVIVIFNGVRHLFRALCLYLVIPAKQRQFKYHHCLMARLGGETVSFISFTGPVLGETTKAILLKRDSGNFKESIRAIVADTTIYYISVLLMILCGALTLLFYAGNVPQITYSLFFVIFFTLVTLLGILYLKKNEFRLVSSIIGWFSKFNRFPKSISKKIDTFKEVEKSIHELFTNRRQTFFILFGLNLLAHITSVIEVLTALYLLGFEKSLLNSFIIESMTKIINLVFSFVPGTLGVYEGGNEIILHTLGYAAAAGITLGLVRKGGSIFWIVIGLLILIWRVLYESLFSESKKFATQKGKEVRVLNEFGG